MTVGPIQVLLSCGIKGLRLNPELTLLALQEQVPSLGSFRWAAVRLRSVSAKPVEPVYSTPSAARARRRCGQKRHHRPVGGRGRDELIVAVRKIAVKVRLE